MSRYFVLSFSLLLALTTAIYWPGLQSNLFLDDYVNLFFLLQADPRDLWSLAEFVFAGEAGPTGRPVALFTFAANYYWTGEDFWYFKATGVFIHLLNGLLVFLFAQLALQALDSEQPSIKWTALAITAAWLLHPLFVSTNLYVIQRMTSLSSTFVLLGLIAYIKARFAMERNTRKALALLGLGTVPALLLAVFTKETGVLLLSYIAVVEFCLLSGKLPIRPVLRFGVYLGGFVPLAIVGWLADLDTVFFKINGEYTPLERLLTETRILWSYIAQSLTPDIRQMSLLHDDIQISRNLSTPLSTLFALTSTLFLIAFAFHSRRRLPVASFSILWFFSGHVIESTVLSLELYYEHRNYLPTLGLLFAVSYYLLHPGYRLTKIRRVVFASLLVLNAGLTTRLSLIWADKVKLPAYWALHHPNSYRTQVVFAATLATHDIPLASEVIRQAIELKPMFLDSYLRQAIISCGQGHAENPDRVKNELMESAAQGQPSPELVTLLRGLTEAVVREDCAFLAPSDLLAYLRLLRENPRVSTSPGHLAFTWETESTIFATSKPPQPAKVDYALTRSVSAAPNLRTLLWHAKIAAARGNYPTAYARLENAQQFSGNPSFSQWVVNRKIAELRTEISEWENNASSTP